MPDLTEMRELVEIVEASKQSNLFPTGFVNLICNTLDEEKKLINKLHYWGFICNAPHFERVDPDGPKRWIWTYQYNTFK